AISHSPASQALIGKEEAAQSRPERITKLIKNLLPAQDLYAAPDFPEAKIKNAKESCAIPSDERILGLVDLTVFGSAKNCLLVGTKGIYYHNDFTGKRPGAGMVPYSEFPQRQFEKRGFLEIYLGNDQWIEISGGNGT